MNTIEVEQLACAYRNAPASPAHMHCDVWNQFEKIGGRAAILYGLWRSTPFRSRWKRQDLGLEIASALDVWVKAHDKQGGDRTRR